MLIEALLEAEDNLEEALNSLLVLLYDIHCLSPIKHVHWVYCIPVSVEPLFLVGGEDGLHAAGVGVQAKRRGYKRRCYKRRCYKRR